MMDAEALTIDSELLPSANTGLMAVAGDLDAHTFEQFSDAIHGVLESGCTQLFIDLKFVDYISSAGVGVLFSALQRTEERGGQLVLLNPRETVKSVLDMLGATSFFSIREGRLASAPFDSTENFSNRIDY